MKKVSDAVVNRRRQEMFARGIEKIMQMARQPAAGAQEPVPEQVAIATEKQAPRVTASPEAIRNIGQAIKHELGQLKTQAPRRWWLVPLVKTGAAIAGGVLVLKIAEKLHRMVRGPK